MAMSAEHRSKFAALHRQWWRLHMSEKFSSGTINSKQPNKKLICLESWINIPTPVYIEMNVIWLISNIKAGIPSFFLICE